MQIEAIPLAVQRDGGQRAGRKKWGDTPHFSTRVKDVMVWPWAPATAPLSSDPSPQASSFQLTHLISVATGYSEP